MPGAGNLISGNGNGSQAGILLTGSGAQNNLVQGNLIGSSSTGAAPLTSGIPSSNGDGIDINDGASNNVIGGPATGATNIISFNAQAGINLENATSASAAGNTIIANEIVSNGSDGIVVSSGAVANLATTVASNTITSNAGNGVSLIQTSGTIVSAEHHREQHPGRGEDQFRERELVLSNSLSADGSRLEIELDNNANDNQPPPILNSAASAGGATTIEGTLQAAPDTPYLIQFFSSPAASPSGLGEGLTLLNAGASPVTTNSAGLAVINVTLPVAVAPDQFVSATATNVTTGDTSPFSDAQAIQPQVSIADTTVIASAAGTTTATFSVSLSAPSSQPVTVFYATADGSALAGDDYTTVAATPLTFARADPNTVTVTIHAEPAGGFLKTFTVSLRESHGCHDCRRPGHRDDPWPGGLAGVRDQFRDGDCQSRRHDHGDL